MDNATALVRPGNPGRTAAFGIDLGGTKIAAGLVDAAGTVLATASAPTPATAGARAVLDITVSYDADLVRVRQVLAEVAAGMWEDEDFHGRVIEEPEDPGVEAMTVDGITVRVSLKTAPMEQWAVARALRERIKARFDHEGIEIPFAQRVVWHRDEQKAEQSDEEPASAE